MLIKNRIIYSSGLLLMLFLLMVTINWYGNKSVMRETDLVYLLQHETTHLQGLFRGINEFIIDEGEPLSVQLTREHLTGFDEVHTMLLTFDEPELRRVMDERISQQWKVVKDGAEAFLVIQRISVRDDNAMLKYGRLTTEAKTLFTEVEVLAKQRQENAGAISRKTKYLVTVCSAVIMLIMCIVLFNLYRSITTPIRGLTQIARAFGNSDLSVSMDASQKDEFGILGGDFNHALTQFSGFIRKLREDINTVAVTTQRFAEESAKIVSDAESQSSQTNLAVSATGELSTTFNDIARNTEHVSAFSRDAYTLAAESGDVVIQAMNSMDTISRVVDASSGIIEGLARRSDQIGDIIKVIDGIADQTNLLALNANIEAARAGDQGRGFAIVANEVRKLAERTTNATREIAEMIKGIQHDAGQAVDSMQACRQQVSSGTALSNKAGSSLKQIIASAQNVTEMIQKIAASVEEQSSAANEITANLETVATIARSTSSGAQRSSDASLGLHAMALELRSLANAFKLPPASPDGPAGAPRVMMQATPVAPLKGRPDLAGETIL